MNTHGAATAAAGFGSNTNQAGQSKLSEHQQFSTNRIAEGMIECMHELDEEGRKIREQLKSSSEAYKDNVQFANNHFGQDDDVKHITFRAKKAFFNHKFNTQELLRSQHLYKLVHELKYTPDKNLKSYPDVLEDGYREVLKVNDKDYEIRDSLLKWYSHRLEMISFVKKEISRQYFQLFRCGLDEYSEHLASIGKQIRICEEAQIEVEDIIKNLRSEKFFKSQKQYEKQHLPELSIVCEGNIVIEKTFSKQLKNFPYITQDHVKRYFNDFVNQGLCTRKIKKIRLINDYLPYKIQFLHTLGDAQFINDAKLKNVQQETAEADLILAKLHKIYGIRRTYLLANDKISIERNVAESAKQLGIKEDIHIDYGCLLLFAIDKQFEQQASIQSKQFLTFHPYNVAPAFPTLHKLGKNFGKEASELMKNIDKDTVEKDLTRIRMSGTWVEKLQILAEESPEQHEQNAVFSLYEDTLVKGWLRFLLFTDDDLISQKLQKDISVLKERYAGLNKQQFEEIFYQFYQRYLKLLFLKSRKSVIKLLSYMNYFRCLQKNINLAFVELSIGTSIEGVHGKQQQSSQNLESIFDPMQPLSVQSEKITARVHDEKFFLTNPCIAHYGNVTQFQQDKGNVAASKEDYMKINGVSTVQKGQKRGSQTKEKNPGKTTSNDRKASQQSKGENEDAFEEPNALYEEEVIEINDGTIIIRDHSDVKIQYDAAVHDFHIVLEQIGQICSFYFHFRIKHDLSQKEKERGLFKDNFDREALIDQVLDLESKYYFEKVKLLQSLEQILKNTYYPDLRQQLIKIMAGLMARRPRMNLFDNSIFECYHYEIENLKHQQEIVSELLKDLDNEEHKLALLQNKIYPESGDKLSSFSSSLKNQTNSRQFNFFMSGLCKLILNIEQSRSSLGQLIPCSQTESTTRYSEILKCENLYFQELLDTTKRIIYDSDGMNLYTDYTEYRFLEKEESLDQFENFDLVQTKIETYVEERLSKLEKDKLSFDAFSMLEFMKVRKKFSIFLFGLSSLLDIYKLQVGSVSSEFKGKFEQLINLQNSSSDHYFNYTKLLLDSDAVKISKETLILDNWMPLITQQSTLISLTHFLESLILCSQLTQNFLVVNNIYFQAVLNDMPSHFFEKIKQAAPEYFRNVFDKKKAISNDTITYIRTQELAKIQQQANKQNEGEEGRQKTLLIQTFCKKIKREVQFEAMKIQTLLQRNQIEKFSKKLPFEDPILFFAPLIPLKDANQNTNTKVIQDSLLQLDSLPQMDEELDSKGEVFFDSLGCAVNLFRMPSAEQIILMSHEDFEQIMSRYGIVQESNDYDEDDVGGDEDARLEKSQAAGGKEWLKIQEQKLEKDICLLLPNKSLQLNKGSSTLKGFRKREFFDHAHLLYLRKTQLFILWKILGNVVNILSLATFECSLSANAMDILYFNHGQLGLEKCKIDLGNGLEDSTSGLLTGRSIKEITSSNKKAIPVFKRNELRLRRDLEILKTQLKQIDKNVQILRSDTRIADSNEAIMSYLEKLQNRHFLSILLLLISQLNESRLKNDHQFMLTLRSMIIQLNFKQISNLATYSDGKILLAKNKEFKDPSADFTQSPDLKLIDSSSPFMNLIRVLFWDIRPSIEDKLHSTIAILNPCRYFFQQFMRFNSILDKGLAGTLQSRITELSVMKSTQDFLVDNFLRNNFIFEEDEPFKYERMHTKIINLQVRHLVLRELCISRKLNIMPFEIFPNGIDPLAEPSRLIKEKIKLYKPSIFTNYLKNQLIESSHPQTQQQQLTYLPEEEIVLDLVTTGFHVQQLLYEESLQFYQEENLLMAKWMNISRKKVKLRLFAIEFVMFFGFQQEIGQGEANKTGEIVYNPMGLNRAFLTGSLQAMDILSILSNFTSKVFFDSTEVKTLNKNQALVISKEDLQKHLQGINLDLIDLIEEKYGKVLKSMEQKCSILEKDVLFEKKSKKLLQRKIQFLEGNIQNIVESQVASRANDLIQEIQHLQKKSAYTKDQRKMDEVKLQRDIHQAYSDKIRENELVNDNTLSRFYDFRKGQKLEVYNMVEGIKDYNFKLLKETIQKALEDHGGCNQALHVIDGIWNETADNLEEEKQRRRTVQSQQQQIQQSQAALSSSVQLAGSIKLGGTRHDDESGKLHENEVPSLMLQPNTSQMNEKLAGLGAPADIYEAIELQNKEVHHLLESFRLLRAFSNMKIACTIEKYEKIIQEMTQNNSSNEQLYRDKKEMQSQTESMKDQVLSLKKTMAIMEYQNEILRRDVERSRKERVKNMKATKLREDTIRNLEERIEQAQREKLTTYSNINNPANASRGLSATSLRKRPLRTVYSNASGYENPPGFMPSETSLIAPSTNKITTAVNSKAQQTFFADTKQSIILPSNLIQTTPQQIQVSQQYYQQSRVMPSPSSQVISQIVPSQNSQKRPATSTKSNLMQSSLKQLEVTSEITSQKLNQKKNMYLSNILKKALTNHTTTPNSTLHTSNPKALTMTYKIKSSESNQN